MDRRAAAIKQIMYKMRNWLFPIGESRTLKMNESFLIRGSQAENRMPDRHLIGERDPDFALLGRSEETVKRSCRPFPI